MQKILALTFLSVVATSAIADVPAPAVPQPTQAQPNPLDKIVCRTEESLGSRLNTKRVCMTLREWKDQADANRASLEKMQQMNQQNPIDPMQGQ